MSDDEDEDEEEEEDILLLLKHSATQEFGHFKQSKMTENIYTLFCVYMYLVQFIY